MGSMNAQLAASPTARAGGTGEMPSWVATPTTSGTSIVADAVFEQTSVKKIVKAQHTAVNVQSSRMPVTATKPWLIAPASPVSTSWVPSAIPPPKSRMIPQSIWAASFQRRTRSPFPSGAMKSSDAAPSATTPGWR